MSDKTIVESKYDEQLLYEIYNNEEEMMTEGIADCRHNCRYCKQLDKCEYGMFSVSL